MKVISGADLDRTSAQEAKIAQLMRKGYRLLSVSSASQAHVAVPEGTLVASFRHRDGDGWQAWIEPDGDVRNAAITF